MPRRVLVAGDLVRDERVARLPGGSPFSVELHTGARQQTALRGAWQLAESVRLAGADLRGVDVAGPDPAAAAPSRVLTLWAPFERRVGSAEQVWRIERVLGSWTSDELRGSAPAPGPADLLVLSDSNLGFRRAEAAWGPLLDAAPGAQVIYKTEAPLG